MDKMLEADSSEFYLFSLFFVFVFWFRGQQGPHKVEIRIVISPLDSLENRTENKEVRERRERESRKRMKNTKLPGSCFFSLRLTRTDRELCTVTCVYYREREDKPLRCRNPLLIKEKACFWKFPF